MCTVTRFKFTLKSEILYPEIPHVHVAVGSLQHAFLTSTFGILVLCEITSNYFSVSLFMSCQAAVMYSNAFTNLCN